MTVTPAAGDAPISSPWPSHEEPGEPQNPLAPVRSSERISALDTLRGFCMLGIIRANLPSFAIPTEVRNPAGFFGGGLTESLAFTLHDLFISLKLMTIFALLFGAGLALQARRAETRATGTELFLFSVWRLLLLAVIGLIHGLVWYGDILLAYALCGLFVLVLRDAPPVIQLIFGFCGVLLTTALFGLLSLAAPDAALPQHELVTLWSTPSLQHILEPDLSNPAWELDAMVSPELWRRLSGNFKHWLLSTLFLMVYGWRISGLILMGMAVARLGWLEGRPEHRPIYKIGLWIGLLGFCIELLRVSLFSNTTSERSWLMGYTLQQISSLALSTGYASAVLLLPSDWALRGPLRSINSVGRMALSIYIFETLIGLFIFGGGGLALAGRLDLLDLWYLSVLEGSLLALFAFFWMRRLRFGPIEWLWRSASYRRWQPILRRD